METAIRNLLRRVTGLDELPVDNETGAWAISLVAHLVLILALAWLTQLLPAEQRLILTSTPPVEEEILPEEFRFANEMQEEIGALADAGAAEAEASAPLEAIEAELILDVQPVVNQGTVQAFDFPTPVAEAPEFTENLLVKGVGSVGTTGAEGAVDRITNEILLSLDQRPTLVVWLFDQSLSLRPQREKIAQRFDRVYEELGLVNSDLLGQEATDGEQPLLTAVASFGKSMTLVTPQPVADLTEIKSAVRAITDDEAGLENVFSALGQLVTKFRHYRLPKPRRNVMFVVFTDEAGDDINQLDSVVDACRKLQTPVYVIGSPAPFGRNDAFVKYVDPDPEFDQQPQYLPVHQGPESIRPERVRLDFIGSLNRRGRQAQDLTLDSGFGPFGLSRLAYETGGVFFAVHPNRSVGRQIRRFETDELATYIAAFFDHRVMRRYRPEYLSLDRYQRFVGENQARAALVRSAGLSRTGTLERVQLVFRKVDEAQFSQSLSRAQRAAAKLEPKVNQLVATLRAGESGRARLKKPRWEAGYDLAIGRALAVKVRVEGYNTMLAQAKQGIPFKNDKNDTWVLFSSDTISTGSVLAKEAKLAKSYLERVTTDHPDTPWALLAQQELSTPFGWEWKEDFSDVANRVRLRGNRNNQNDPDRKKRRPAPKL